MKNSMSSRQDEIKESYTRNLENIGDDLIRKEILAEMQLALEGGYKYYDLDGTSVRLSLQSGNTYVYKGNAWEEKDISYGRLTNEAIPYKNKENFYNQHPNLKHTYDDAEFLK